MVYFTLLMLGVLIGGLAEEKSYKRMLRQKAVKENRTAECICGEFYYIVPEPEYVKKCL